MERYWESSFGSNNVRNQNTFTFFTPHRHLHSSWGEKIINIWKVKLQHADTGKRTDRVNHCSDSAVLFWPQSPNRKCGSSLSPGGTRRSKAVLTSWEETQDCRGGRGSGWLARPGGWRVIWAAVCSAGEGGWAVELRQSWQEEHSGGRRGRGEGGPQEEESQVVDC